MKKYAVLLYLLVASMLCVMAQNKSDAENYYNSGNYTQAKEIYAQLLKRRPNDALLNYCYAKCLCALNDIEAKRYFELAQKKYPKSHLLMGDLYFNNYYFAEAANEYSLYLDYEGVDSYNLATKIEQCKTGEEMLSRVELIEVIDSIVVPKQNFLEHYNIPVEAGELSLSTEGVNYTTERRDRRFATHTVNAKSDIYYSYLLLNEWSTPTAISSNINSPHNENYPFVLGDGITIYFASDNPSGLGGYDIYVSRFSSITNDYLPAQNLGMPFNSTANDYMFAIDETNQIGMFATDRWQKADSVTIYKFRFTKEKKILKDMDAEQIKRYAQLKQSKRTTPNSTTASKSETTKTSVSPKDGINFVVNNNTIYQSCNDFKSETTRTMYNNLVALTDSIEAVRKRLQQQRSRYNTCSDIERTELSLEILANEHELRSLLQRFDEQTLLLRKKENQLLQ